MNVAKVVAIMLAPSAAVGAVLLGPRAVRSLRRRLHERTQPLPAGPPGSPTLGEWLANLVQPSLRTVVPPTVPGFETISRLTFTGRSSMRVWRAFGIE